MKKHKNLWKTEWKQLILKNNGKLSIQELAKSIPKTHKQIKDMSNTIGVPAWNEKETV
jgi:hypothetical protein